MIFLLGGTLGTNNSIPNNRFHHYYKESVTFIIILKTGLLAFADLYSTNKCLLKFFITSSVKLTDFVINMLLQLHFYSMHLQKRIK